MRKLLPLLLILGLITPIQTANAIFGLSKCEKVKKEMLNLESNLVGLRKRGLGTIYKQVVFGKKNDVWVPDAKTLSEAQKLIAIDPLPKIWKLGFNNPKCFTNTQKLHIDQINKMSIKDHIEITRIKIYSQIPACKKFVEGDSGYLDWNYYLEWGEKCFLREAKSINYFTDYKSIYNY